MVPELLHLATRDVRAVLFATHCFDSSLALSVIFSLWHKWALSNGPLQHLLGEASHLVLDHIVLDRQPLKMYTGFKQAVLNANAVPIRKAHTGTVLLLQRNAIVLVHAAPIVRASVQILQ